MDSQPKRSSSAFEYFLYAAILVETGLAAVIYAVIFRSAELMRLRVYFAIFYVALLVWAIAQLKLLHRNRTLEPELAPRENTRSVLGLTRPQLVILLVVFAIAVATFSWALRVL